MTAVVTGASGTIGRAIAIALSTAGHPVIALGRDADRLATLRAHITAAGGACTTVAGDLDGLPLPTVPDGPIVLVNAAGVHGPLAPVAEVGIDEWERVIAVNLLAAVACTQALLPGMLAAGWGRVVNVSSAAAAAPAGRFNAPYATSKAALNRFTAHVAAEVAGTGVTAHAMHPGDVVSRMHGDIAQQAAAAPRLSGFAAWARATGANGDDPRAAARAVVRLLDDEYAQRVNGWFLWPDGDPRAPFPLR